MEVLTLNGKKYVKASKAARDLGYASDYVGQLCRKGAVDAHLVGRTWYVNPDTLGAHRVEKRRNARAKAREYARKTLEETRALHVSNGTNTYKNIAIRYEGDDEKLIPEIKKVPVSSFQKRVEVPQEDSAETYTIENPHEKIIMSGSVPVHDAELEEQYTDTTVLTPKIQRRPLAKRESIARRIELEKKEIDLTEPVHSSFEERIASFETDKATQTGQIEEVSAYSRTNTLSLIASIMSFFLVLGAIASLFIAVQFEYEAGTVKTKITLDQERVADFVANNIKISDKLPG